MKNDEKYTFFDVRGASSLGYATHPADDCFRGLLMVHEDRFELARSGGSAFEVVFRDPRIRCDQPQVKNDEKYIFFDVRDAASLGYATHPAYDCFRWMVLER